MLVYRENTTLKGKVCMNPFSLSNMGEKAWKSHVHGEKMNAVKFQAADSVSTLIKWSQILKPEMYSTIDYEKPSTSLLCGKKNMSPDLTIPFHLQLKKTIWTIHQSFMKTKWQNMYYFDAHSSTQDITLKETYSLE